MPSSRSSTLFARVGFRPRMPIFGRKPESLLVAHVHARHLPQRLVGRHHAALLERLARRRYRPIRADGAVARDCPAISPATTTTSSVRPPTRSWSGRRRVSPGTQRHALNGNGEPGARRGDLVIAWRELGNRKRALTVGFDAALESVVETCGPQSERLGMAAPVSIDDLPGQRSRSDLCGGRIGEQSEQARAAERQGRRRRGESSDESS